jgi:VCBS repeat-containing protein
MLACQMKSRTGALHAVLRPRPRHYSPDEKITSLALGREAPDADFNGKDSFTYTVSDGIGGTATVTITVTPDNDLPTVTVSAGGACGTNDRSGTINNSARAEKEANREGRGYAPGPSPCPYSPKC